MQDRLAAVGEIYMVKLNVLPLRRQVFAIDVHRFYVQNCACLMVNGHKRVGIDIHFTGVGLVDLATIKEMLAIAESSRP